MEAEAIKTARGMGCLVVASAGNSNLPTTLSDGETYGGVFCSPAGLPGVLTVMAADEEGELASFSNYDTDPDAGAEYEIMAPGVSILSTTMGGGYGYMDGTSMACPVVAGAAAVLMGMGCDADSAFQIIASCAEADAGRVDYQYPLLDLEACVERAKETTTFNTDPVITNCSVMASLADIDFGHGSVCFDAMNTTSHVYYYNEAFKSALSFSFENIGGSGDVTITGSVGGCPIDSRKCSVKLGGEENGCVLEFSGTPAVDSDGDVEIKLYANGVEIYHGWMAAYDLKTLPTDAFYYYPPEPDYGINFWMAGLQKSTLTLSGSASKGTVWVIDAITFIPADCTLFFERQNGEKSCVIYEADGQFLMTSHDDTTGADGQLVFNGADLIGEKNFWASSSGTTIEIYGCNVYDPYILGISYAAQNAFLSNTFYPPELQGNSICISGFYNCYGLKVDCNYYWGNMVNGCIFSEITASQCISNNTFVENFASIIESTLKCYAPDYAGANVGFYDNCVIGPIEVYQVDSPSTLAEVYQVYHQSVGTTNEWGNSVLPTDETDKVCCASTSTTTEDISTMRSWGIHLRTPAFVTGMETLYYEVDTENDSAINYLLRFHFSAPVILPAWASFYSYSDDMTGTAAKYLSDDGTYCDVYGTTVNNGMDTEHWYRLSGYYQYSMELDGMIYYLWNTAIYNQSSYRYPVCCDDWYYNSMLDMLTVSGDRDGRTLTWSDGRITAAYRAEILRSVNGGEYVRLADNISGTQYTDSTQMESDTLINYQVVLTGSGVDKLLGTATYLISLPDADQGVDLQLGAFYAQDSNTLSLRTAGKVVIDDCLSFRFPGLDATSVAFGEQVAASGIAYGAASDDEGTTVYLGSGDSAILDGGETLFTLGVTGADGEITVSATNGDAEQDWGKMDSVSYAAIEDGSGEVRKLWSSGYIFLARYNADGKLLGIENLSGAYTMERPQSGREAVFCLSDGLIPLGKPITSGDIS